MPPLKGAAENYNTDAQLHTLRYAKTTKVCLKYMLCSGSGAHQLTKFNPFLALQAEIWYGSVFI